MADREFNSSLTEMRDEPFSATLDDGSVIFQDGEDIIFDLEGTGYDRDYEDGGHDENLANKLSVNDRVKLGHLLIEMVAQDEESRAEWLVKLREGLQIIGIEEIPTESSAFDGSSTVNHPAIAESMVRFQANALEELFPAEGPVKAAIIGKSDPDKEAQSVRVADYMNYQLTEADDEYFGHTDQMLMYLPYAGSAFKKIYHDQDLGMTVSRFVKAENFIIPYDATSLATSPRYTHKYELTGNEINRKIRAGEFIEKPKLDPKGGDPVMKHSAEQSKEIKDIADDRQVHRHEDDSIYTILEVHKEHIFDEFDQKLIEGEEGRPSEYDTRIALPYVITMEEESGEILAIRRLWSPEDKRKRKRIHFIHYKFLPGLGFYGWGYLHLIGNLGKAASGALRALLDGAATASLQGGFKSKESKVAGEFIFTPGVWKDVDMVAEDLAKSFYTPPFKEPSPALFQTLNLLVEGIKSFSSTADAMTGMADNKGPVGTTLALIEQGSKIYSGIHKRMHRAAKSEFKMISLLNYEHMDDDEEYPYDVGSGRIIMREDFDGRVDILPVSDPNIYSSVQRMAIVQAEMEMVKSDPEIFDRTARRIAYRSMLQVLKSSNIDLLLPENEYRRLDPITENQSILAGGRVKAFVEQDHTAHLAIHDMFEQEIQGMGLDPQAVMAAMLNLQAHKTEHNAHAYRLRIEQELDIPLPDTDFTDEREGDVPIEVDNAVARAVASTVAPPPPAQGPPADDAQEKESEHEQKLRHTEQDHEQRMKHKDAEVSQKIDLDREESENEMRGKMANKAVDVANKVESE